MLRRNYASARNRIGAQPVSVRVAAESRVAVRLVDPVAGETRCLVVERALRQSDSRTDYSLERHAPEAMQEAGLRVKRISWRFPFVKQIHQRVCGVVHFLNAA